MTANEFYLWLKGYLEALETEGIETCKIERILLKMDEVKWIIVTEQNYKKVFDELRKNNKDVVVFGLTDDNYEVLSMNFAQVRNYIILQGNALKKYKEYYENGTEETSEGK